ncbi:arsenite efflux MFS transporter ArsK [Rhizobium sp. Root1204]|uniref:arsenite efflux MFS transporter ArsK n=1 Tax=Rhizobium sp. Root1204 TaxID=1736428 RepID=UPI00071506CD|nr:arsenite efflux MFS transporter ArsK [Rhizobium sp. Root1204]KQV36291.1 MFS transporter [Rhizobium sp. Root1204]
MERRLPLWALIGLGATQIIGYGTVYYAFSILAADMARDLGKSDTWVFGAFSVSLLVGSFFAPPAGRLADRFGAGRMMAAGSAAVALTFVLAALSPGPITFALALIAMQAVAATVLYATAFTAIVQAGGSAAKTSIVHLTLIAGFASTLFWPLTAWLHTFMSWREIFMAFAVANLALCFPLHWALSRLTVPTSGVPRGPTTMDEAPPHGNTLLMALMLAGFAIEGYALSAVLAQLVPLTQALGLGASGLLVATLFGPAQVASRLINLIFGRELSQAWLAVIAAALLPVGLAILLWTTPWFGGAVLFALCAGLGSGLTSIVGGTLPLELFGRKGYGKLIGWSTFAKQVPASVAPFAMSASLASTGVVPSLWIVAAVGIVGLAAFVVIPFALRMSRDRGSASYRPTT